MINKVTINIEKSDSGYQGTFTFHELDCHLIRFETKNDFLNSAKETVEEWLKDELVHLKLDIKDIQFMFKFVGDDTKN